MDDTKRRIARTLAFLAMLLPGGCSTLPDRSPSSPSHEATRIVQSASFSAPFDREDPFLKALETVSSSIAESPEPDKHVSEHDSEHAPESVETTIVSTDAPREDEERLPEETDRTAITIAVLETELSKNHWVRNYELARWIENGMNDPNRSRDTQQLRRMAEINRLNMSEAEIRKKERNALEYSDGLVSTWRWYHPEIETILAVRCEVRPDPVVFLQSPKYQGKNHQLLRANAALLMGRSNDPLAKDFLLAAVTDSALKVELRCAAVETLGKLRNVSADELIPLLEHVKEKEVETVHPVTRLPERKYRSGISELWTELLAATAEKIAPWEHSCFLEALGAKNPKTRQATVKLWQRPDRYVDGKSTEKRFDRLPEEFLDYARMEVDPMIRIEVIKTLGHWREPRILELLRVDLSRGPALRGAALDALADAGCRDAIPIVKEKLRDPVGKNRAKAVQTLRKLGSLDDVYRLYDDESWEVRLEVAQALADRVSPQTVRLAGEYLSNSLKVQEATIDAVAGWPVEAASPILLEALKCDLQSTRRRAADALIRNLPEAKNSVTQYDVVALPKTVADRHAELVACCRDLIDRRDVDGEGRNDDEIVQAAYSNKLREVRPVPEAILVAEVRRCLDTWNRPGQSQGERKAISNRLTGLGDRLLPVVESLHENENRNVPESLDAVLAEVDPLFAVLVRLDTENAAERRRVVAELQRWSKSRSFGSLATRRILDRALQETDTQALCLFLDILKQTDAVAVRELARSLLDSEVPELRQRACDSLRETGDERDLDLLAEQLSDRNERIVRGALEAVVAVLDRFDAKTNLPVQDVETVRRQRAKIIDILQSKLLREDRYFQADVAAALYVLGDPAGEAALRRLAASPDPKIRHYTARTLSTFDDDTFVPILIQMLDDRGDIRRTALAGLPRAVGHDVGFSASLDEPDFGDSTETERKIARWKRWAAQR